jgi:hypothetical protein
MHMSHRFSWSNTPKALGIAKSLRTETSDSGLLELEGIKYLDDNTYALSINGIIEYESKDGHAVLNLFKAFKKN